MRHSLFAAAALVLLLGGCHHPRGTFALVSPEAIPGQYRTVYESRVWGEHCVTPSSLAFDLEGARIMYREAARNALAHAPGANALRNARFWIVQTPFWVYCAHVDGLPVTLR